MKKHLLPLLLTLLPVIAWSQNITFADANVKALCVTNWDTDGDGELSEAEAAAVTRLGDVFKQNENITSFDELQYFTGLKAIDGWTFTDSKNLTSIIIPANVKSMGCVTASCGGLTSIKVDPANSNFDSRNDCNAIIETATDKLVAGCNTTIIPEGVKTIGGSAFHGSGLTAITFPSTVTTIENGAFAWCGKLATVTLSANMTSIGEGAFEGCNLTSVTVNNSTPVTIVAKTFSNRARATLYVPAGAKAAYEAADVWKEFKEIIETGASSSDETELWNDTFEVTNWNGFSIPKDELAGLKVGDMLHVVIDVPAGASGWSNLVSLKDGKWEDLEGTFNLSETTTEATFLLTGDIVGYLKTNGLVLSGKGYTAKRVYTTPTGYTGSENSIWLGRLTMGDIGIESIHFKNANGKTGVVAGDIIRLTYTGTSTPIIRYNGGDAGWAWQEFTDAVLVATETGADMTVTEAMATLLNKCNFIIQAVGDDFALTQVELLSASTPGGEIVTTDDNTLYAADLVAAPGSTPVLSVHLDNKDEVRHCQFDLRLPAGVTIAKKANEKLNVKLTNRAETHTVSTQQQENGDYRFIITSMENDLFTGNSGALVQITLSIPATMENGDYTVKVLNGEVSVPNGNDIDVVKPAATESKLTVKTVMAGDVNNDGSVSVTDVGYAINYILEIIPSVFVFEAADMNGDKSISVTDVGMIINHILNNGAATVRQSRRAPTQADDVLTIPAVQLEPGETVDLNIELSNTSTNLMGWQCDISLPEGLSLVLKANGRPEAKLGNRFKDMTNHSISSNQLANGDYRFIATSTDGDAIPGTSGTLFTVTLKADASLTTGTQLTGIMKGIEINTQQDDKLTFDDVSFKVAIGAATMGDSNGDGVVDINDALAIFNYVIGKPASTFNAAAADMNGDGVVDIADAVKIVNLVMGKN